MFFVRLRSSIILVVLALITMLLGDWFLLGITAFLSVAAYRELGRATGVWEKRNGLETGGIACTVFYYILLGVREETGIMTVSTLVLLCIIFVFMAGMFVYVFSFPAFEAHQIMAAFFSFVYGPVCLSFIYLTRELRPGLPEQYSTPIGLYVVWLILISSWGCDTCAYCVGMLFGKHKMSPVLSPKKSVEGAIGGVLGAALLGALYGYVMLRGIFQDNRVILFFALICGAASLISMAGDLAASAIKRNAGIKDYGKLIPGHGGVMDRFDSVIFTAPVIYFMTVLLFQ